MQETLLQDRFILPFLHGGLGYREVKPNTVSNSLIIEEDLAAFVATTTLNEKNYAALLRKYGGDRKQLLADLIAVIQERSASSRNMALFLNANKSVTLRDVRLHLFYTGDSAIHGDDLFAQNIFSVVQELPYAYKVNDQTIFAFRPDLCFFVNGIYLGYSELKSNFMGQSAGKNGRSKVVKDYFEAVRAYHDVCERNARLSEAERTQARRDLLKVFERAIHITATDVGETYVIRNLADYFEEMLALCREGRFDRQVIEQKVIRDFKPYPLRQPAAEKAEKVKEIFTAHYAKDAIEKEILYYNFIERAVYKVAGVKELKAGDGVLIAPRPKQKFGTDKVLDKVDEFLAHEHEDDYFLARLEQQLAGVSPDIRKTLIDKRRAYSSAQIGDQIKRLVVLVVPPDDNQDWTIGLLGESDIIQRDTTTAPNVDLLQTQPFAVQTNLGVLGGAAHIAPAQVVHIPLQLDAVELSVTQHDDGSICWQQALQFAQQLDMHGGREVSFLALLDQPHQRNGPLLVDEADHQGHAAAPHLTAVYGQDQCLGRQPSQQLSDKRQHVHFVADVFVLIPSPQLLFAARHFGAGRRFLGHRTQMRASAGHDAIDKHRQHSQTLRQSSHWRRWINLM